MNGRILAFLIWDCHFRVVNGFLFEDGDCFLFGA